MRFPFKSVALTVVLALLLSALCSGCAWIDDNMLAHPSDDTSVSTTTPSTTGKTGNKTKTTTTTTTGTTTIVPRKTTTGIPASNLPDTVLSVPIIAQFPYYPTGCETISAVMALRYYGEDISAEEFVANHLPTDDRFRYVDGVYCGPNPYTHFVGHPESKNSYGCMAPVIEKALISYFGSSRRVKNTTGQKLSSLCSAYIDKGEPVLIWTTIGMVETYDGPSWQLEDGSTFVWPVNEHCMVLIGYDNQRYYFADPYRGMVKSYPRALCESRYEDLGMQSIAITK